MGEVISIMERLEVTFLGNGTEPPDNGDMEARVKALEIDMRDVRERLTRIEVKFDALDKKVTDLPSKDFVGHEVSKSANKIIVWVIIVVGAAQLIPSVATPLLKHFGL